VCTIDYKHVFENSELLTVVHEMFF